ncbi:hypothetical protein AWT69_002376 [Pseudomonas putida]|nr:hypothetical protein AWT69_002376 [Pseudomonas putida]
MHGAAPLVMVVTRVGAMGVPKDSGGGQGPASGGFCRIGSE